MKNLLFILLIFYFSGCLNENKVPLSGVESSDIFIDSVQAVKKINEALSFAKEDKFSEAINIITPLALDSNSEAQYWLSKFYSSIKNQEESSKWLNRSAKNNYYKAQHDLAWSMCGNWFSADIDKLVEIIYWFERAGYNGSVEAYAALSVLYDDASAEEEGRRKVFAEMKESAENGNAMAQFNMGWIYARGLLSKEGFMQDLQIAEDWFRRSASLGFIDAIDILRKNFD